MSDNPPTKNNDSAPRPCFTLFDAFHFILPLAAGAGVFLPTSRGLGFGFASAIAVLTVVASFWLLRYAIPALVLFLYRRQIGRPLFRHDVACYVVAHFRKGDPGSNDKNA